MELFFIIPAYNEADNICRTINEIDASVKLISKPNIHHKIIIVDDCSTDQTFEAITGNDYSHVFVMRLSRRSGSHVALRVGLQKATGDAAICIAADGQDDPQALPKMVAKWVEGNEVVWALRSSRDDEPLLSRTFAKLFYKLLTIFSESKIGTDLSRADFYLLDTKVVKSINQCEERNTSLFGLIVWLGFNQSSIEYERKQRRSGITKWNFKSKMALAKDWIIAFSGIPLRLLTYSGFFIAGIGFLYAFFIIISSVFKGSPVEGWSSVMTIILILGGGQAIMLGIIGEYLWRTLDESRKRPFYFIEKSSFPRNSEGHR